MNAWANAISQLAAKKLRQGKEFQCFYFEALDDGSMLVKGTIPTRHYSKGTRKGTPDFKSGKEILTAIISPRELKVIDDSTTERLFGDIHELIPRPPLEPEPDLIFPPTIELVDLPNWKPLTHGGQMDWRRKELKINGIILQRFVEGASPDYHQDKYYDAWVKSTVEKYVDILITNARRPNKET